MVADVLRVATVVTKNTEAKIIAHGHVEVVVLVDVGCG